MVFLALLRGINVGGKSKVEMAKLKVTFENLGFTGVRTYIASGNVIFRSGETDTALLTEKIEAEIEQDFGLPVKVVLRDSDAIRKLVEGLPSGWVNDVTMKCDVMFLWPEIDRPEILAKIPHDPAKEDVIYLPGAVVWRIDRDKVRQGQVLKIIGTDIQKQLTVRNPNTVRKLWELMREYGA